MRRNLSAFKVAALDTETDPFLAGRVPKPFCAGFRCIEDDIYIDEWGKDCVPRLMERIADLDGPYLIYVHNGGRFDFHFLYDYIDPPVFIIHGRLIEFTYNKHVFRDSLAAVPVALDQYQKDKVDYRIFEASRRELPHNKKIIRDYLRSDCQFLNELMIGFKDRFHVDGTPPLTVGSAAMRDLKSRHPFERATQRQDGIFRPFYFGGRNQCFEGGIIKGPWRVYDVNSQYPTAMRNFKHPIDCVWDTVDDIPTDAPVFFVEFEGTNFQALPQRIDGSTEFTEERGTFRVCSHELITALKYDLVKIERVLTCYVPERTTSFKSYVDHWYSEKVDAKKRGDKANELFSKLMLNSAYGKFGQNPAEYKEYALSREHAEDDRLYAKGYEPEQRLRYDLELWSRPAHIHRSSYYDVSVAASITSAARSIMLEGLSAAERPIYCDTDSLVCKSFRGEVSDLELGAWKFEGEAEWAAIAGRKTYCLFNRDGRKIIPIKWASKGGDLDPREIIQIAKSGEIEKTNEVPTFRLGRDPKFIKRIFRSTHKKLVSFKNGE